MIFDNCLTIDATCWHKGAFCNFIGEIKSPQPVGQLSNHELISICSFFLSWTDFKSLYFLLLAIKLRLQKDEV